jgi:hypothetical protein
MAWRLRTKAGRARDAKRQATVEPVLGRIKPVMGFRPGALRGRAAGAWTLVTLAFTLKRRHVLNLPGGGIARTYPAPRPPAGSDNAAASPARAVQILPTS